MGKLKRILGTIIYLPWTLYFNFHYLPFKQARKLPILLYKPKLLKMKGVVQIWGGVKFGMIRLGFPTVSIYSNDGIMWENKGKVTFLGNTNIGNDSKISVGKYGDLTFGQNFGATACLKCICYNRVVFDRDVLIGWDCLITDTDFHSLHVEDGKTKGYGEIHIGNNNWIAMQSLVLKGSKTPAFCTLSARTMLNKDFTLEGERILLAGQPAKVVKRNIYHDRNDDAIDYNT